MLRCCEENLKLYNNFSCGGTMWYNVVQCGTLILLVTNPGISFVLVWSLQKFPQHRNIEKFGLIEIFSTVNTMIWGIFPGIWNFTLKLSQQVSATLKYLHYVCNYVSNVKNPKQANLFMFTNTKDFNILETRRNRAAQM